MNTVNPDLTSASGGEDLQTAMHVPGARREFTMTESQEKRLLDAMRSVPYMIIGGMAPRSVQENANDAWMALGDELGFMWNTVSPVAGKGQRVFSAIAKAMKDTK
jgi:hypothetical protein